MMPRISAAVRYLNHHKPKGDWPPDRALEALLNYSDAGTQAHCRSFTGQEGARGETERGRPTQREGAMFE